MLCPSHVVLYLMRTPMPIAFCVVSTRTPHQAKCSISLCANDRVGDCSEGVFLSFLCLLIRFLFSPRKYTCLDCVLLQYCRPFPFDPYCSPSTSNHTITRHAHGHARTHTQTAPKIESLMRLVVDDSKQGPALTICVNYERHTREGAFAGFEISLPRRLGVAWRWWRGGVVAFI